MIVGNYVRSGLCIGKCITYASNECAKLYIFSGLCGPRYALFSCKIIYF